MLTIADVKAYLNISTDYTDDDQLLTSILHGCEFKVRNHTGLDPYEVDEQGNPKYKDLCLCILMLCSSAYNRRDAESDSKPYMSNFVQQILDMHCQHLVG